MAQKKRQSCQALAALREKHVTPPQSAPHLVRIQQLGVDAARCQRLAPRRQRLCLASSARQQQAASVLPLGARPQAGVSRQQAPPLEHARVRERPHGCGRAAVRHPHIPLERSVRVFVGRCGTDRSQCGIHTHVCQRVGMQDN
eukprot:365513-Chlamydomonas_euryale.AAC.7